MRRVGERGDAELAEAVGRALGEELAAVGVDIDFAPVLDVDTNPANPVIGERAFAARPEDVIRLAGARSRGGSRGPACSRAASTSGARRHQRRQPLRLAARRPRSGAAARVELCAFHALARCRWS
jgi:beta-N-acetylhexosaminidase